MPEPEDDPGESAQDLSREEALSSVSPDEGNAGHTTAGHLHPQWRSRSTVPDNAQAQASPTSILAHITATAAQSVTITTHLQHQEQRQPHALDRSLRWILQNIQQSLTWLNDVANTSQRATGQVRWNSAAPTPAPSAAGIEHQSVPDPSTAANIWPAWSAEQFALVGTTTQTWEHGPATDVSGQNLSAASEAEGWTTAGSFEGLPSHTRSPWF